MASTRQQTALIVLGMHRSGTSALAGVLGHLGAALPQDLMAPSDMNAKGFFESNRITGLNDRLLAQAGFTWWDPRLFPATWFGTPEAEALLDEAVEVLRADYGDARLFVMKDPRICRLLPFWIAALDRFGARVRIVHTHRAAWDVAASLSRWAEYEPEFGLILWARHVLDAEADSRALLHQLRGADGRLAHCRAPRRAGARPGVAAGARSGRTGGGRLSQPRPPAFSRGIGDWARRAAAAAGGGRTAGHSGRMSA